MDIWWLFFGHVSLIMTSFRIVSIKIIIKSGSLILQVYCVIEISYLNPDIWEPKENKEVVRQVALSRQ